MRQILILLGLISAIFCQQAYTEEIQISLNGEKFTKKFVSNKANGDKLLEFIRDDETFEKWSKLVGFRYQQLPGLDNDPEQAALSMNQILKVVNPLARSMIFVNKQNSEAIIDFITWPKDGSYLEFNVFRYAKSNDGKAVVSLQIAYRFTDISSNDTEKFKKLRESSIKEATSFDIKTIHAAFEQ